MLSAAGTSNIFALEVPTVDPHDYFAGQFAIRGRNFHFDFFTLNHAGRGAKIVGDGHPGEFSWDGTLKKLDNGEMNFEATQKVLYDARLVISKISAKRKSTNPPTKSSASVQAAPPTPTPAKPTPPEAPRVGAATAPAANGAGARSAASTDSSSGGVNEVLLHSKQMVYSAHCQFCHATGVLGTPIFGDKEGWAGRLKQPIKTIYAMP